jgi:hypothetical protein
MRDQLKEAMKQDKLIKGYSTLLYDIISNHTSELDSVNNGWKLIKEKDSWMENKDSLMLTSSALSDKIKLVVILNENNKKYHFQTACITDKTIARLFVSLNDKAIKRLPIVDSITNLKRGLFIVTNSFAPLVEVMFDGDYTLLATKFIR